MLVASQAFCNLKNFKKIIKIIKKCLSYRKHFAIQKNFKKLKKLLKNA